MLAGKFIGESLRDQIIGLMPPYRKPARKCREKALISEIKIKTARWHEIPVISNKSPWFKIFSQLVVYK